ncbi:hypothetical protein HDV02_000019 [Globomyces sp. JEL0801]|nr:hypothetical protein HDV02_000019 [Globomyces sp. JEL0801]
MGKSSRIARIGQSKVIIPSLIYPTIENSLNAKQQLKAKKVEKIEKKTNQTPSQIKPQIKNKKVQMMVDEEKPIKKKYVTEGMSDYLNLMKSKKLKNEPVLKK